MTPEGLVKKAIRALLESYSASVYYEMHVPGGYGKQGLDFTVSACGHALYIEAKAPGERPTGRQRDCLRNAYLSGAAVFIISNKDGIAALARWLHRTVIL